MCRVNIVIITCCPEKYLYECLASIKAQTCRDFSVLIVLNGQAEPYLSQIRGYIGSLEMTDCRVIYSPEAGLALARSIALNEADAEYILFVDDDDFLNPEYLAEMMHHARPDHIAAPEFIGFTDGDMASSMPYYVGREFRSGKVPLKNCPPEKCISVFNLVNGHLIPLNVVGSERFEGHHFYGEDAFFMFRLLAGHLKAVDHVPQAKYFHRIRKNSNSRSGSFWKKAEYSILMWHKHTVFYLKHIGKVGFFIYLRRLAAIFKGLLYKIFSKG